MKSRTTNNESGVSLALGVIFIAIVTGLAALVVGLGLVATAKSRIQNTANLAALGVLETITKQASAASATVRANQIASSNAAPGLANALGNIEDDFDGGAGGKIEYGRWHYFDNGTDPCAGNYPCFQSLVGYSPNVNAVKVTVNNQAITNPILTPFANIFGYSGGQAKSEATAFLAGQCTALLMDTSLSTTYDTHIPPPPNGPGRSYFVYNAGAAAQTAAYNLLAPVRPIGGPVVPTIHYQNDYKIRNTILGPNSARVDSFVDSFSKNYLGPEPYRTLFLAANASLRDIYEFSAGNLWRGFPIEGVSQSLPVGTEGLAIPSNGFAFNPGILVQLTNIDNRGTFQDNAVTPVSSSVNPNILDFGWFPHEQSSAAALLGEKTNIIEGFEVAINSLESITLAGACPPFFKKTIILVTDGVGNCAKTGTSAYSCQDNMTGYTDFRSQLLSVVSQELAAKKISVIVLFAGNKVGPNFINRVKPPGYITSTSSNFLNLQEAIANGYGAFFETNPAQKIIDETATFDAGYTAWCGTCPVGNCLNPACQNMYAMQNMKNPGNVFRMSGSVLAQLAIDSNGLFCPLMPLDPISSHYIDQDGDPLTPRVLDDAYRIQDAPQTFAIEELSPPEQAARCVHSLWHNQYILAEPS